jgi:hypothetical protein
MNCLTCGEAIAEGRLKALPNTRHCTACSTTQKVAGFPLITGKNTYSELQIVNQETATRLFNAQQRNGLVSKGVKSKTK